MMVFSHNFKIPLTFFHTEFSCGKSKLKEANEIYLKSLGFCSRFLMLPMITLVKLRLVEDLLVFQHQNKGILNLFLIS